MREKIKSVNHLLEEIETIPIRERERCVSLCGNIIKDGRLIDDFTIDWMDCAEGILIFIDDPTVDKSDQKVTQVTDDLAR